MQLHKGFYLGRNDNQKAPSFKSGEQPHTMEEIQGLNPKSIVGVLASNVIMIDCDNELDVRAMDKALKKLALTVPTMKTTRGKHYYFSNFNVESKSLSGVRLACGIKADVKNGDKTAFDCIMTDGQARPWENYGVDLIPLPTWLKPLSTKLDTYSGMNEGSRNQTIMNELGVLKRYGLSYDDAKVALSIMNSCVFADPLPNSEFDHVTRKSLYDNAYNRKTKPKDFVGRVDADDVLGLIETTLDGVDVEQESKGKRKRFDHEGLARAICESYHVINVDGMLMQYDNGVYLPTDKDAIERIICASVPDTTIKQRSEVYASLKLISRRFGYKDTIPYLDYFAFSNGVFKLDLESQSLVKVENDPERLIFNRIPYPYDPNAYNDLLNQFLDDIACGDQDIKIQLAEMLGHCLMRRNSIRGIFVLLGKTSNGKSTFLDMASYMLGRENTSHIKMHELSERFNKWQLGYKLANIGDDISTEYLPDSNIIKSISTSDCIAVERKGKDAYTINPYCTLMFSANELPRLKDSGTAMLNRVTIIPFNAEFNRNNGNHDSNLLNKLIAPEVLTALVNMAVWGLIHIRTNDGLLVTNSKVQYRVEYAELNNPVLMFIKDNYWDENTPFTHHQLSLNVKALFGKTPVTVYGEYKEFCQIEGLKPLGKTKFTNALLECLNGVEVKKVMVEGERAYRFTPRNEYSGSLNLPSVVM